MPASDSLAMHIAGQGRLEVLPPEDLEGARFEGRFVIWGITGPDGPLFGEDVSLFDADQVVAGGRGPQSAHLVAMRSGFGLEMFSTGDDTFAGHMFGRASSKTRLRIFFDERPDGTRSFDDRDSWLQGEQVAVYKAEEFFQMDGDTGIFETRVNYTLLESTPFTFKGVTVDFADIALRCLRPLSDVVRSRARRRRSPTPRSRLPTAAPGRSSSGSPSAAPSSRAR